MDSPQREALGFLTALDAARKPEAPARRRDSSATPRYTLRYSSSAVAFAPGPLEVTHAGPPPRRGLPLTPVMLQVQMRSKAKPYGEEDGRRWKDGGGTRMWGAQINTAASWRVHGELIIRISPSPSATAASALCRKHESEMRRPLAWVRHTDAARFVYVQPNTTLRASPRVTRRRRSLSTNKAERKDCVCANIKEEEEEGEGNPQGSLNASSPLPLRNASSPRAVLSWVATLCPPLASIA
ncbi:hypothetical protein FQA47_008406 [Oryzias melastigma]|uniref:Uncharacterized protein n=1 Tax=Oryzias melastigma TaxID=30732 RepID=A0A834CUU6_ORYME|nr:hypothetical protein FQA47_008406 [Oryzias melastigma]